MSTDRERLAKRVEKGMAFLLEKYPKSQLRSLSVEDLNINDACRCVIGKLEKNYWDGLDRLGLSTSKATRLGFMTEGLWKYRHRMNKRNSILTELWRDRLNALT